MLSDSRATALGILGLACLAGPGMARSQNADPSDPSWNADQKAHWSFALCSWTQPMAVHLHGRPRNPIDAFNLRALENVDLVPAPEADRWILIRRLNFDVTVLQPTPEDVDVFLGYERQNAYERLIDRLLAMPTYGERWASAWLDLARFAESDGIKGDRTRPNAWRYRDRVIKALNDDLPYDRFVALQLAGDEVAPGDQEAFVATGFNRNYQFEYKLMITDLNRQLMLDDMTASVFLGLTVACARCHDHKYDPISQRDYYRLQAHFGAIALRDYYSLTPLFARKELTDLRLIVFDLAGEVFEPFAEEVRHIPSLLIVRKMPNTPVPRNTSKL
jgi:hypothetical protein